MEQSKLVGGGTNVGGGWLSRQFRRVASWIDDSPLLKFFLGNVSAGLEVAADLASMVGWKTSTPTIELTALEEQQLNNWADNFTSQLRPKLEQFARYSDQYSAQQKIDSLNDMYRQLGAIQAHFSAPTVGYTTNQIAARKQFVEKLTGQLRLKVEFLTTEIPVQIQISNKNIFMNTIDTNGITTGSSVVSVIVPQISTNVKTGAVNPELIIPNIPSTGISFNPEASIKDVATTEPIKTDPGNTTATPAPPTPTTPVAKGKGSGLLKALAISAGIFVMYKVLSHEEKKEQKKSKKEK